MGKSISREAKVLGLAFSGALALNKPPPPVPGRYTLCTLSQQARLLQVPKPAP